MVEVAPTPNYRANLAHVLGVYLVTDEASCAGRRLTDVVMAAVQGGASCVQLREKNLSTRNFCAKAIALQALLAPLGVALVINDRVDIALACGAPGVHLGQSDMPVAIARRLLPPAVFLGLSVETLAQVAQAATAAMAGVDYLGVSPVFATPTKTDTGLKELVADSWVVANRLSKNGDICAGCFAYFSHSVDERYLRSQK